MFSVRKTKLEIIEFFSTFLLKSIEISKKLVYNIYSVPKREKLPSFQTLKNKNIYCKDLTNSAAVAIIVIE